MAFFGNIIMLSDFSRKVIWKYRRIYKSATARSNLIQEIVDLKQIYIN